MDLLWFSASEFWASPTVRSQWGDQRWVPTEDPVSLAMVGTWTLIVLPVDHPEREQKSDTNQLGPQIHRRWTGAATSPADKSPFPLMVGTMFHGPGVDSQPSGISLRWFEHEKVWRFRRGGQEVMELWDMLSLRNSWGPTGAGQHAAPKRPANAGRRVRKSCVQKEKSLQSQDSSL